MEQNGAEDFASALAAAARSVEVRLGELLAPAALGETPPLLADAMRHAVFGGGKRLRPFLLIESARLFAVAPAAAIDAAAAVECLHCYSLVHDDLPVMDNDELRRGQPTVWKAFDEATAILAGDALLTLAFEIMARPATHPDAVVRAELVLELARAAGAAGMVGGQVLDLASEEPTERHLHSFEGVARIQRMKTGALIRFACEAGAIIARADAVRRAALVRYGEALGAAFQIADDLLDAEGDAVMMGKAAAKDAAAGKATFVTVLGIDGAKQRLAELEATAIAALAPFGAAARRHMEAVAFVAHRTR